MINRPTPYYENKDIHISVEVDQPYSPEHGSVTGLSPMGLVLLIFVFWFVIARLIIHYNFKENGIQQHDSRDTTGTAR